MLWRRERTPAVPREPSELKIVLSLTVDREWLVSSL
jgi:hypothetical protein